MVMMVFIMKIAVGDGADGDYAGVGVVSGADTFIAAAAGYADGGHGVVFLVVLVLVLVMEVKR